MKKSIFSENPDMFKTAIMSWRMDKNDLELNLAEMADGFEKAAVMILKQLLDDNSRHEADSVIFPVLYTINQSIELYMKAIIRKIDLIEGAIAENLKTHNLIDLFQKLIEKIKKHDKDSTGLDEYMTGVKDYIDEICSYIKNEKNIPQMDFARYPFDTEGHPYFFVSATDNISIDIEKLLEVVDDIHATISSLYVKYSVEYEDLQK